MGEWMIFLEKLLKGKVPDSVKLIIVGGVIVWAVFAVRDFKQSIETAVKIAVTESQKVRAELRQAAFVDSLQIEASDEVRAKLLRKANARLRRLYENNNWVYEDIEP